jgi:hypothetical protein
MGRSQLHTPGLLLKTDWKRRSEGKELWLSHVMGFEKGTRREDARSM